MSPVSQARVAFAGGELEGFHAGTAGGMNRNIGGFGDVVIISPVVGEDGAVNRKPLLPFSEPVKMAM